MKGTRIFKIFGEKIAVDHIGFEMEHPGIFGLEQFFANLFAEV